MFAIRFTIPDSYWSSKYGRSHDIALASLFHHRWIAEALAAELAERWGLEKESVIVERVGGCAMGDVLGA
jgi:hypothetical protein